MPNSMSVGPAELNLEPGEEGEAVCVCESGITWTSDNEDVATVRKTGAEREDQHRSIVTGQSEGAATIYAVSRDDPLRKVGLTVQIG